MCSVRRGAGLTGAQGVFKGQSQRLPARFVGDLAAAGLLDVERVREALALRIDVRGDNADTRVGEDGGEFGEHAWAITARHFDDGRQRGDVVIRAYPGLDREGGGAPRGFVLRRRNVILNRSAAHAMDEIAQRVRVFEAERFVIHGLNREYVDSAAVLGGVDAGGGDVGAGGGHGGAERSE